MGERMEVTTLTYASPDREYVTVREAAERWGISAPTLRKRREELGLPLYLSPADTRLRLLSVSELVEALGAPVVPFGKGR